MSQVADKKPKLICPYCSDVYTKQAFFDKHVAECEDNPANGGDPKEAMNADLETNAVSKKDPKTMTEIERLEYELAQKKAEVAKVELEKQKAIQVNLDTLASRGLLAEPDTVGSFRLLQTRNHNFLAKLFDEQDKAGFDFVNSCTLPTGVTYLLFKKRG